MDLVPVIEALQATLSPQLRQQAEEKLAEVRSFLSILVFNLDFRFSSVKRLVSSHVSCKLFSVNNVIWVLDKRVHCTSSFIAQKSNRRNLYFRCYLFEKSYQCLLA